MSRRLLSIISFMSVCLTGIGFYMDTDRPNEDILLTGMEFILMAIIVFGILVLLYVASVFVSCGLRYVAGNRKGGY